jgi:hypothetical protein
MRAARGRFLVDYQVYPVRTMVLRIILKYQSRKTLLLEMKLYNQGSNGVYRLEV